MAATPANIDCHHYASANEQKDEARRAAWIESLRLSDCSIDDRASCDNNWPIQQLVPADHPPDLSPSALEIVTQFEDIDFGEPHTAQDGVSRSTTGEQNAVMDGAEVCDSPFLAEIMTLFDEFDFGFDRVDDTVTAVNELAAPTQPLLPMIRLNSTLEAIMECLPSSATIMEPITSQPAPEPQQPTECCQPVQIAAPQVSWPAANRAANWPIQAPQGQMWLATSNVQSYGPSKRAQFKEMRDFNSPLHTKVKEFVRVRSFTDIYADEDKEWIGKRVVLKKGKYAGRGALVKSRANKKYRVMVDGLEHQIEFYCTTFAHDSSSKH